jgi:P4 family phage/plasmid primase-like protien
MAETDYCGECAKFKKTECPWIKDVAPPVKTSQACPDFRETRTYVEMDLIGIDFHDADGKFDTIAFAKAMLQSYAFKTMKDNEVLYVYNHDLGIYAPDGEQLIKQNMAKVLDDDNSQRYYADVVFHIKGSTYFERPQANPKRLVLKNGILNLETMSLEPFTPNEFHLIHVPVIYDPKAECPAILQFLQYIVGEKQLDPIQEFIGYCLHQIYDFHTALMLAGNGKNGKSTLLTLLTKFLGGNRNVSHQTLQALCYNRFAAAELYAKLANTCADIPSTALTQTGMFKMLVGNDPISAERKYGHPFSFTNIAKLIFSCNKGPETKDDTDAYFRRWMILACNNVFSGKKCNPHIIQTLTTESELSGLLNWALQGMKRLFTNEHFTANEDIETQRKEYIRKSNSSKAFIEERLQYGPSPTDYIPEAELYEKYILFCQENRLPTNRKGELTQNLHQILPQAKQTVERISGKNVHVWQHITCLTATTATTLPPKFLKDYSCDNSVEKLEEGVVALVADSLIPCPFCKAQGKPMSFVSDNDLRTHVTACHEPEDHVR